MTCSQMQSQSKCHPLLRKRDRNPFLDAAVEFLFTIVECEVLKKQPAFIKPSVPEFYTFCSRSSHAIQTTKKRHSKKSNPISLAIQTTFRFALGSHLTNNINHSKRQIFQTCLCTVLLAILGYSEFLNCMDLCDSLILEGYMQNAVRWYFSHYFLTGQSEKAVQIVWQEVIQKRQQIFLEYIHCKPSLKDAEHCLEGMQGYFLSEEFQTLCSRLIRLNLDG